MKSSLSCQRVELSSLLLATILLLLLHSAADGQAISPDEIGAPAVLRAGSYLGFEERFNRYYTDPDWTPSRTLYVSRTGSARDANASSSANPLAVGAVVDILRPGDMVVFQRDALPYTNFNYQLLAEHSGTLDNPVVFFGERNDDGSLGVELQCAVGPTNHTSSCFNVESAHYIAIDGFEMVGGYYGVRAVGTGYAPVNNQFGLALLNNHGHDQYKDPFFTGQSSWVVVEGNLAHGAGTGDGHGIYLSNGGDWNIVRFNELFDNASAGFQINADPSFTCQDEGIDFFDPRCDGAVEQGLGQGVSEYMLLEGNYFHGDAVGVNFTSVRNSVVRHNIFGPSLRHNTSFWQETDNPALGSHSNLVENNLLIGNNQRHVLQFINHSNRNTVRGNIVLGLSADGQSANANTVLVEMDSTTVASQAEMAGNYYLPGRFDGYTPNGTEVVLTDFSSSWFVDGPFGDVGEPADWTPDVSAPAAQFGGWKPVLRGGPALAPTLIVSSSGSGSGIGVGTSETESGSGGSIGNSTALLESNGFRQQLTLLDLDAGQLPNDTGLDNQTVMTIVEHAPLGGKALRVQYAEGDSFGNNRTGVLDWRGYHILSFSVDNPTAQEIGLDFMIRHTGSVNVQTRVRVPLLLAPGVNFISLDLGQLRNGDGSKPLLGDIRHWYLVSGSGSPTLYFREFALNRLNTL